MNEPTAPKVTLDICAPEGHAEHHFEGQFNNYFGPVFRHLHQPRLTFQVGPQHLNPVSTLHGGALATSADMMITANYQGAGGQTAHCPTINMSMDYVATAKLGQWLEAHVTLVKRTTKMMFVTALIRPMAKSWRAPAASTEFTFNSASA